MVFHLWCLYGLVYRTFLWIVYHKAYRGAFSVQIHGLPVHTRIGQLSRFFLCFIFSFKINSPGELELPKPRATKHVLDYIYIYCFFFSLELNVFQLLSCFFCLPKFLIWGSWCMLTANVGCSSFIHCWSFYSSYDDCSALLLRSQCCISTCSTKGVQSKETFFISLWPALAGISGEIQFLENFSGFICHWKKYILNYTKWNS